MLSAFLWGLLAAISVITIIVAIVLGGKWLFDYVQKKLKNRQKHKVAFADTREILSEVLSQKADLAKEYSMEEIEKLCEEAPYVSSVVSEETGETSEYEGIRPETVNPSFQAHLKENGGLVLLEV